MHFVTGGAFNGKRAWVKNTLNSDDFTWISAYEQKYFPDIDSNINTSILILEGVEQWVRSSLEVVDGQECRKSWKDHLYRLGEMEKNNPNLNIILIGTDITKGIVPMEKENRLWRDVAGWVYQDIVANARRVDVIWYGINQTIKEGE